MVMTLRPVSMLKFVSGSSLGVVCMCVSTTLSPCFTLWLWFGLFSSVVTSFTMFVFHLVLLFPSLTSFPFFSPLPFFVATLVSHSCLHSFRTCFTTPAQLVYQSFTTPSFLLHSSFSLRHHCSLHSPFHSSTPSFFVQYLTLIHFHALTLHNLSLFDFASTLTFTLYLVLSLSFALTLAFTLETLSLALMITIPVALTPAVCLTLAIALTPSVSLSLTFTSACFSFICSHKPLFLHFVSWSPSFLNVSHLNSRSCHHLLLFTSTPLLTCGNRDGRVRSWGCVQISVHQTRTASSPSHLSSLRRFALSLQKQLFLAPVPCFLIHFTMLWVWPWPWLWTSHLQCWFRFSSTLARYTAWSTCAFTRASICKFTDILTVQQWHSGAVRVSLFAPVKLCNSATRYTFLAFSAVLYFTFSTFGLFDLVCFGVFFYHVSILFTPILLSGCCFNWVFILVSVPFLAFV